MMKSLIPWWEYSFMMCQRIGLPPISTMGFGLTWVSSLKREPKPPARITAFISSLSSLALGLALVLVRTLEVRTLEPGWVPVRCCRAFVLAGLGCARRARRKKSKLASKTRETDAGGPLGPPERASYKAFTMNKLRASARKV